MANKFDDWAFRDITARYSKIDTCLISTMPCPYRSLQRTLNLLSFEKVSIRLLEDVITGHYMVRRISERKGCSGNNFYRSCFDEEKEKFIKHLPSDCSVERGRILQCLGNVLQIHFLIYVKKRVDSFRNGMHGFIRHHNGT